MISINQIQNIAGQSPGKVTVNKKRQISGQSMFGTLRSGIRRILERVGILRSNPSHMQRQQAVAECIHHHLEMRFNPDDLHAAGLTRERLESPGGMDGHKLARDLEAVHSLEADRFSDRRMMATDLRNISPSAKQSDLPPAVSEHLPADYDSWSSERRNNFTTIYRRVFDAHLETAIHFEHDVAPCDEARVGSIAKAATMVATKESASPEAAAKHQAAWNNFNSVVHQYLEALSMEEGEDGGDAGASSEHFEALQQQLALKHHVLSNRALPVQHQSKMGFDEARQLPMIMAIRSAKSELAAENPNFVANLSRGIAKHTDRWAAPMLASSYLRIQGQGRNEDEILREATGSHLVVDMLWTLSRDQEIGSEIELPPWVATLQPGGLLSSFDYDQDVLPELHVSKGSFEAAVGRARTFVDNVKEVGMESYLSEEPPPPAP